MGSAPSLVQHGGVRVEADDTFEEVGQPERDNSRTATDVEQAAVSVERQHRSQRVRETFCVGDPAPAVILSGSLEKAGVPVPILPPESPAVRRHGTTRAAGKLHVVPSHGGGILSSFHQ
jgi:hypothetical protein